MSNRVIKYRCWDKVLGKMFEPSSLSWKNGSMWVCDVHGENKMEYEMIHPNAELMQFTGLTDKNGKEIYEGDILDHGDYTGMGTGRCLTIVRWSEGSAAYGEEEIKKGRGYGGFFTSIDNKVSEVIGNIYENPSLLPAN